MACYSPLQESIMLRRKENPTVKFGQRRNGSKQEAHYFVTRLTTHAGSAERHEFRMSDIFFFFFAEKFSENLLRLSCIRIFGICRNLLDYFLLHCRITFPPFLFVLFRNFLFIFLSNWLTLRSVLFPFSIFIFAFFFINCLPSFRIIKEYFVAA